MKKKVPYLIFSSLFAIITIWLFINWQPIKNYHINNLTTQNIINRDNLSQLEHETQYDLIKEKEAKVETNFDNVNDQLAALHAHKVLRYDDAPDADGATLNTNAGTKAVFPWITLIITLVLFGIALFV